MKTTACFIMLLSGGLSFPPSDRLMVFIRLLTPIPRSQLGPKGWAFPVRQQGRFQKSTGPACKSGRNEDPSLCLWTPSAGPARACQARLGCRLPGGLFLKDLSAGRTHSQFLEIHGQSTASACFLLSEVFYVFHPLVAILRETSLR